MSAKLAKGRVTISNPTGTAAPQDERLPSRLDHLLAVGRREFLAHGYQWVSVEGIGKAAGVSKQTIYRHFSDKSDILRAIIEQTSSLFEDSATAHPGGGDALEVVRSGAATVRNSFLGGETIDLIRLGISIATAFQELAGTLNGYQIRSLAPIAGQLAVLARGGGVDIPDPLAAAAQLGGLAVEGSRYLMGFAAPSPDQAGLFVPAIADLYLNGFNRMSAAIPAVAAFDPIDDATVDIHRNVRPHFDDAAELRLTEQDLQRLIVVARRKIFAAGYRDSSLDDIGAVARVGRGTLYRWFGGKEGLFRVVMLHAAAEIGDARLPAVKPGAPIQQTLFDIAMAVSAALMTRAGTQLYRTMIAEAAQYPDLARIVFALTRMRAHATVVTRLGGTPVGRTLTGEQLNWLAQMFLTLCTDGNRYLSVDAKLTLADRRVMARRAVDTFLYGHRKLG